MGAVSTKPTEDLLAVNRCLDGNSDSLGILRNQYHPNLKSILLGKGASESEAEDLLADFWGDCVPTETDRPSIFEKFNGRASLKAWMTTVVTNRFYDLKRRQKFIAPPPARRDSGNTTLHFAKVNPEECKEWALLDLLRDCLQKAFDLCPPDASLMLRLVYLHNITQREVGVMWNWHESKVSRRLTQTTGEIQRNTLNFLKAKEPSFELRWEDFLELCDTFQLEFGRGAVAQN